MICPRSAILHSAAASIVEGTLGVDRFHRREDRHLRRRAAKRMGEIDRVLDDVHLVLQGRGDVDCRIGDDERLVEGRHIHDEAMADAPVGAQPRVALHHGAHQLVGMEAALHQRLGPPFAHNLDSLRGRRVAVRDVNTFIRRDVQLKLLRDPGNFRCRTDQNGPDEPHLRRVDRSLERALVARVRDRGDHRVEAFRRCDEALIPLVLLKHWSLARDVRRWCCAHLFSLCYANPVMSRSEKRERVIDDEPDIVAAASAVTEIHVAVAQPDPHAAQGSFLNAVVDRNIVLVLIGEPTLVGWIHGVGATGKVEGDAEALDVVFEIIREPEQPGLFACTIKIFFNQRQIAGIGAVRAIDVPRVCRDGKRHPENGVAVTERCLSAPDSGAELAYKVISRPRCPVR